MAAVGATAHSDCLPDEPSLAFLVAYSAIALVAAMGTAAFLAAATGGA